MAIWQYQIFIVPEEEITSYFKNALYISTDAFNDINWWKYRQLNVQDFNIFKKLLTINKSWSSDIILLGDENSNCIEILNEENKILEIFARIDLRKVYTEFVKLLCEFATTNNCVFLNNDLKIISPHTDLLKSDIEEYPIYKSFLDKFTK